MSNDRKNVNSSISLEEMVEKLELCSKIISNYIERHKDSEILNQPIPEDESTPLHILANKINEKYK